jgi:hypothetical protein
MPLIVEKLLCVCPLVVAALLLLARAICQSLALPAPSVAEILAATGAPRSTAYELLEGLVELLPTLVRTRGRPPKPSPPVATTEAGALTRAVLGYVMARPGCVHRGAVRQQYSDAFRLFVVELRAAHPSVDLATFAAATELPLGTLKDWLCTPARAADTREPAAAVRSAAENAQMQTVLDAWSRWDGTFLGFCKHVKGELRLPFGRELVARILDAHGLRRRARRGGRTPDEAALRGAFRTFFPGAQWVGDGMQVPVIIDGRRFTFNLELDVDAHTGALVGASVRPEEDAAAVVEAFHDGVVATGAPPLALLLDNRPSNHTAEVDAVLGDTIRIRATPERAQNKAHVEGAFGLFSQVLPDLVLETHRGAHDLAAAFLRIVVQLWARTTNHRPRKDRGGRSRVELHAEKPTPEQIEHAKRELREIAERQLRARRTLEARRRPEVLSFLDTHFERLALLDPERHIRIAIAGHSFDAIVDAIATFEGKRVANTLPDGADARYLLGIVRNLDAKTEGEHIGRRLFELRLEAQDSMLASLIAARDRICANLDFDRVLADCVDRALAVQGPLERTFWLDSLADAIRTREPHSHQTTFAAAVRRIEATFAVTPRERHDAVRLLADRLVVLA